MKTSQIIEQTQRYLMNTYARLPVAPVKGRGVWVWDADGKKYLDFFSGLAVNNLGHSHPRVLHAIARQARTLLHVSNLFYIDRQAELARLLVEHSFADKAFFCNSGAEANEAAVKLARKYAKKTFGPEKFEIVTMRNSFHGRTLAMISATGQEKFQKGFEPLVPGFRYATFGDLKSLEETVGPATCAVMVEPVQGEGGIRTAPADYFKGLREFCNRQKLLLIFDEVQTGIGRTGTLFAYEQFGIEPDLMTLAKALASGIPIGALLARDFAAEAFQPGDHAATFGGNPFSTAVAVATLKTILGDRLSQNAKAMGVYFLKKLEALRSSRIRGLRGAGLMIGVDLDSGAREVVNRCIAKGLLINAIGDQTLRILPPLIVRKKEIDQAVAILEEVL